MPPNTQKVKLKFTRRRSAKVMGSLAKTNKNKDHLNTIRFFLNQMFQGVQEQQQSTTAHENNTITTFTLYQGKIQIILGQKKSVAIVQWDADPVIDVLVDSTVALLMHAQSSIA